MAPLYSVPSLGRIAGSLLLALPWASTVFADDKIAADYFVEHLPGVPSTPEITMHAGHIETDPEHNGNLFFWHFEAQKTVGKQRTVIWLNGGPGCSSEDGALMEIGPYRVRGENLEYNNGSWNEFANLLFVDNPVGTGFSYVDTNAYLHELDEMADQFITFLEKFFSMFPEYATDDIYIAGESYAGQHIPYIARHILDRNQQHPERMWNLAGLVIGNGWISPMEQYDAYLKFAYEKELLERGSPNAKQLEQQWKICRKKLATEVKVDTSDCEEILQRLLEMTSYVSAKGGRQCINMYDVRLTDSYPSCGMNWPPDLEDVAPYLRRSDVVNALHVNSDKTTGWKECNGAVGSAFRAQKSQPSRQLLPALLEQVPITLFSGAEDLICNHIGTENLIAKMDWNGAVGFQEAPRLNWTFDGEDAGYWQQSRNLTYVLFNEASHMVPFDWPLRSRDMLDRVMKVNMGAVGGVPINSKLDGEVDSGHSGSNSDTSGKTGDKSSEQTPPDEETQKQVDEAKWKAYYRSGEVVLVIVIIAAGAWGWYVWRDRRRRRGYQGLAGGEGGVPRSGPRATDRFLGRRSGRDVEAGDFDESQLDDLTVATPTDVPDKEPYAIGGDTDDEEDSKEKRPGPANGSQSRTR